MSIDLLTEWNFDPDYNEGEINRMMNDLTESVKALLMTNQPAEIDFMGNRYWSVTLGVDLTIDAQMLLVATYDRQKPPFPIDVHIFVGPPDSPFIAESLMHITRAVGTGKGDISSPGLN